MQAVSQVRFKTIFTDTGAGEGKLTEDLINRNSSLTQRRNQELVQANNAPGREKNTTTRRKREKGNSPHIFR